MTPTNIGIQRSTVSERPKRPRNAASTRLIPPAEALGVSAAKLAGGLERPEA